jgi:hypothetical protein
LKKLFWVAAICAAPLVLGTAAYVFGWYPGARSNYGELLDPKPVSGFEALRGKWVLITFDAAGCDAYCEKKLYYMRQVRTAQGKERERIERVWALTDGGRVRPELLAAIEGTRIIRADAGPFPGDPVEHVYVVDPLGNLMMRFPPDPDPSRMLKDLKRLLRYSRIG